MATIKLMVRGKRNPSEISARFVNGREIDLTARTNIFVNPAHWDRQKGDYRNIAEIQDRSKKSVTLNKLKVFIMEKHNDAYMSGDAIDKFWLEEVVKSFFNRPVHQKKIKLEPYFVYYGEFIEYWLKQIAPTWRTEKNKYMSRRAVQQYQTFQKTFLAYQGTKKIKIRDIDSVLISDYIDFICDKEGYSHSTSKRLLGRFRFFLNRAEKMNIKVNMNYKEPVYLEAEKEDIAVPYLNEEEIERIFNLDLSHDIKLDNIRDSFLIGVWSGLRISDFNSNLDISNIDEDYINIRTKKTGTWVTIPLHHHVKSILEKRHGNLPVKYSDQLFNEKIKDICMLCNIDQEVRGKVFNGKKKRKVLGHYKKHQLISSHTCRRSFCTNLYGVVPNNVIQSLGGWATEAMMMRYMKKTKKEAAEILKRSWDEKYK